MMELDKFKKKRQMAKSYVKSVKSTLLLCKCFSCLYCSNSISVVIRKIYEVKCFFAAVAFKRETLFLTECGITILHD